MCIRDRVTTITPGTNDQLQQKPLFINGDTIYLVDFDARSNDGADLRVSILQNASPFTNYGLSQLVPLETSLQHFSYTFTSTAGDKTDARLMFRLYGNPGTTFYIDNVVVRPLLCGNNVVDPGEDCDEGGIATVTCNANCTYPLCGDSLLNRRRASSATMATPHRGTAATNCASSSRGSGSTSTTRC